jgi:hypothetical protein
MLRTSVCAIALMAATAGTASAQAACDAIKNFSAPDMKITGAAAGA